MRISVVIPAFDVAAQVGEAIHSAAAGAPAEIIVADGGSRDGTAEAAAAAGARVVTAPRGRGSQLNHGAARAAGDVLVFLHADTRLPPGWAAHVRRVLSSSGVAAGAFALRIDGAGRLLRLVERAVNLRSRVLQRPYGDQALFMRAQVFRDAGGFPDIPVMEDYAMLPRLRRRGRIAIADAAVVTSARRWSRLGVLRTVLLNQACLLAFRFGVAPRRIARLRRFGMRRRKGPSGPETAGRDRRTDHAAGGGLRRGDRDRRVA